MPRRFTEEEVQRIFALVAERHRAVTSAASGLSLAELEEAAEAAGFDPALVAAAAAELDAAPHPERTLAGAPVEVVRTRVVGGPLDDRAWEQMVSAARSEFGEPGMSGQVGRLREWTSFRSAGQNQVVTRVTAEPADDGTRVTVSRSIRDMAFGFTLAAAIQWAMALLFTLLAVGGVEPDLWIPAALLAGLGTLFGLGVGIGTRVWHRRDSARFERLLDRLERCVRDAPAPDDHLAERGGPRLDLDALGEPPDAAPPATRGRSGRRA